jgi:hypothetical protein
MSSVKPVEKELTVKKNIEEVNADIMNLLAIMKGKFVKYEENYIECDFGSLLKSRLIGEFWVSKATLPKKAEIHLEGIDGKVTKVKIHIKDTHKYGVKWGYVKKYEEALQEVADSIVRGIE